MDKDKILKDTLSLYRNCKSFRAESRFIAVRMDFKSYPVYEFGIAFRTWFSRPHSLRLEWTPIVPSGYPITAKWSTLVGDNSQATIVTEKKRESFGSIDDAMSTNPFAQQLWPISLVRGSFDASILEDVKGSAQFPNQEVDGRLCHHLVIYEGKTLDEIHLWIDTSSNIIRKVERAMTPLFRAPLQLMFKLFEKVSHSSPSEPAGGISEIYDDVELNPLIHPATFSV